MGILRVRLLGGFSLQVDDEPVPPIASRAGRALFAYLICNRRPHPREELAARFWPDLPESRARRRLSHTLWQIQDPFSELLDAAYIDTTADTLAFNGDAAYWLDVEEFEQRLLELDRPGEDVLAEERSLASLRRSVELYHGDFLSGYYDDWVLAEQERLRQRYVGALRKLTLATKARGHYEEALTYARRITNQDGLDESAHREVMRLCVLVGRPSEALRQYERARSVLAEELGADPAAATTELYERIAEQRHVAPLPPDPVGGGLETPFVGRDGERRALVDALERGLAGRGSVVFIEGEPGVGKTRLAGLAADDARWRGMLVLRAFCHDRVSPYEPLAEAFEGALTPLRTEQLRERLDEVWLLEVARVIPRLRRALGSVGPQPLYGLEASERTREGFVRFLLELAAGTPTVLVLEDAHWVDDESLQVLAALARRALELPLVIVLTYRASDARTRESTWQGLRSLDRAARPLRLVLGPLDETATTELARTALDGFHPTPDLLDRLHGETGGNPLFVVETLRMLRDRSGSPAVDARLPLPQSIRAIVDERVATLTPAARDVLEAAAVQAVDIDLSTLRRAAQLPGDELLVALEEVLRRGMLDEGADGYAFGHDLVRRAIEDSLPPSDRRRLHRAVAEALEETRPDDVEALAMHFLAAELPARALRYVVAAARRAEEVHAFETAGRRYGQALELLDRVPLVVEQRFDVLAAYEQVLDILGRRDEQAVVLERMRELGRGDRKRQWEVERRSILHLANTDRFPEAQQAAATALALATAGSERVAVLTAMATAMRWAGKVPEAAAYLERAVAEPGIGQRELAEAQLALARASWESRQYGDAHAHLRDADRSFEVLGDLRGKAEVLASLAAMQMETGEGAEAEQNYRRAIELNSAIGARQSVGRDLVNLGNALHHMGLSGQALEAYGEAVSVFDALDHRRGVTMARLNAGEVRLLVTGDIDGALADAGAARGYFSTIGDDRWEAFALASLADGNRRRGALDRARQLHRAACARAASGGDPWSTVEVLLKGSELQRDLGLLEDAVEDLDRALTLCHDHGFTDRAVLVQATLARVLLDLGRAGDALRTADTAVAGITGSVERSYVVHFVRSVALRQVGRDAEGRAELETSHTLLDRTIRDLPAHLQQGALQDVREHREIITAWRASGPSSRTVLMASADAPVGRPLRDEELIEVTIQLQAGGDRDVRSRREALSSILTQAWSQGAAPTHEDLAALLDVSATTIRRDLRALETDGLPAMTRGSRAS